MIKSLFQAGCDALASGDYLRAIRLFRDIITSNYELPEIWNNLGIALFRSGSRGAAIDAFRHAISISPSFAEAYNNLGHALSVCGYTEEGLTSCRKAISINPSFADALNNAGIILSDMGQHIKALRCFSRACALAPGFVLAWNNLGNAQKELGRLKVAAASFRKAIELAPDNAESITGLASIHMQRGNLDEAVSLLKRAIEVSPFNPQIHSSLIMTMNYSPRFNQAEIAEESRFWNYLHGDHLYNAGRDVKKTAIGRRIRIGYVSADFHRHPVGTFLKKVLESHDKTAFDVTCYQNGIRSDAITADLKQHADRWKVIVGLGDQETAAQISSDGIDILIDLSGHTAGNRLSLFANKPAPIQATWLGYFHTTGLTSMDYIITDEVTVPSSEDHYYSEKVIRLPHSRFCYSPPAPSPFVDSLPASSNGFITFGSFNNIAKLTEQVIRLWARIMLAVPDSRLVLKWKTFERSSVRKRYISMFASHGINPERIEFRGASSHFLALAEYNDIDIALDPFPFNGGLTSCEAMWMGVPVVALLGDTPIGRQTASFLNAINLPELIGKDEEQYLRIASALAGDFNRLASLRNGLRERMESSPLCDGRDFTHNLEDVYRKMVSEASRVLDKELVMPSEGLCLSERRSGEGRDIRNEPLNGRILFFRHQELFPQKILRVCYLVPVHVDHKMVDLLMNIVPLHDREKVEPIIYSEGNCPEMDFGALAHRYTGTLSDYLFARLLCHDSIDVLIDLAQGGQSHQRPLNVYDIVPVRFSIYDITLTDMEDLPLERKYGHAHLLESAYREKWLDWFTRQRKPRSVVGRGYKAKGQSLLEEVRALRISGQLEESEKKATQALQFDPGNADAHRCLGEVLVFQGRLDEGMASFRRALQIASKDVKTHSNLLFTMNYLERCSSRDIFVESLKWGGKIAGSSQKDRPEYPNDTDPTRRIRIGYVSEDFRRHSVSYFFEPLISNHDHKQFEVYCYSSVNHPDEITSRIKGKALFWRECSMLEDRELAQLIRDDRIDILVDLAGHSGVRIRLPVFAEKPAPVQVSWLGYPNTTGLPTIDYRFTDGIADPESESDKWYTEKLVRLPNGFLCFHPSDNAPDVSPPPVLAKGFITFGSFNMLPKLSEATIDCWAQLLKKSQDSHILIKNHSFRDIKTRDRFLRTFEEKGIPHDRIRIVGTVFSLQEHLALYNEIDIALDTFPYNGTATTCEALWMGVPVISFPGERHAGRVGASILRIINLHELLAEDLEGYVEHALTLSQDIERLVEYRTKLRDQMINSSLCNGKLFALNVESAYRDMWQNWCRSCKDQ